MARADLIASKLADIEGTNWVDQLWWDGPPKADAPAVVSGSGPPAPGKVLAKSEGWMAVQVGEMRAVQMWLKLIAKRPHQKGRAYDWMAAIHPLQADMKRAHW